MKVKRFFLLVMAICLASGVKAQIYNTEILFYVLESTDLTNVSPQDHVNILRFKDGMCWRIWKKGHDEFKKVCDNLKSNSYYYEYTPEEMWIKRTELNTTNYNSDMSNEKWYVYSEYNSYVPSGQFAWGVSDPIEAHTSYYAFKRDLSAFMEWSEPLYHLNGEVCGKRRTFKRISKEEIKKMSFTGARDFLQ